MKNGKKPTRKQKVRLGQAGLAPGELACYQAKAKQRARDPS